MTDDIDIRGRDDRGIRRLPPLWRGVLATDIGLMLGLLAIFMASKSESAEAFAAMAAAVVGIGAHEIGLDSGSEPEKRRERHRWPHRVLWVSSAAAAALAIGRMVGDTEYMAAALTIIVAAVGVIGLHHAHENGAFAGSADEGEIFGWSLILVASFAGAVGILWRPDQSGAVATLAAALVALGIALLGHARGRQQANASATTIARRES